MYLSNVHVYQIANALTNLECCHNNQYSAKC